MATTAKNFTPGIGIRKPIRMIVLHSAENQQLEGQAQHLAEWFAGKTAPQASAHYMVDDKQVVQSVDDTDVAWAVGVWAANLESISIEMTGQAAFTAQEWSNQYSKSMINQVVGLAKRLSQKYSIPAEHLSLGQILDGKTKGFCTHADITAAYKVMGGHTDPGPNFPLQTLLDLIKG
jgi:N-acetyl-anhydromuramyl-L-alanine amidase AmpD